MLDERKKGVGWWKERGMDEWLERKMIWRERWRDRYVRQSERKEKQSEEKTHKIFKLEKTKNKWAKKKGKNIISDQMAYLWSYQEFEIKCMSFDKYWPLI